MGITAEPNTYASSNIRIPKQTLLVINKCDEDMPCLREKL